MNHVYSWRGLDRAAHLRKDEEWLNDRLNSGPSSFIPLWREKHLVSSKEPFKAVTFSGLSNFSHSNPKACIFLGLQEEKAVFALDFSDHTEPPVFQGGRFEDLRIAGPLLSHEDGALLAYARGMCHWERTSRFCPRCGEQTKLIEAGHQKICTNAKCATSQFPRTDPAVIMLVHRENSVVLGRQRKWPAGMHSILAGYVEPGESLEDAVVREVQEEVGIFVKNVRYHSSQPWPFPSSLMLGFIAETRDNDLKVNAEELESACWFDRQELRNSPEDETFRLPRKDSIARRLLDEWLLES